jgi:hypothetical protein
LVAEAAHQPVPEAADVAVGDGLYRPFGEAVAGQRRDDEVEARPLDAVGGGVGQERHQRQVLDEATRPAVGQDQRKPTSVPRSLVHEVDAQAVDGGLVLGEPIEVALLRTPVEVIDPVLEERLQVFAIGALLPWWPWRG